MTETIPRIKFDTPLDGAREELARKAKEEEKRVHAAQASARAAEAEAKKKPAAHKQPTEIPV